MHSWFLMPSLDDLPSSCCLISRAANILKHRPGHHLLDLLPSGRRYSSIKLGIDSLFSTAIPEPNIAQHWLSGTWVTVCTAATLIEQGSDICIPLTALLVYKYTAMQFYFSIQKCNISAAIEMFYCFPYLCSLGNSSNKLFYLYISSINASSLNFIHIMLFDMCERLIAL